MDNLTEYGKVIRITGDIAHVKFIRSAACGRCRACGMLAGQNEIVVQTPNTHGAVVGDSVAVSIRIQKAMRASALAYAFPLLMLMLGVLTGWLVSDALFMVEDVAMALFGLGFALLAFVLLKIAAPLYNKSVGNVYKMIGIKQDKGD